ncbi:hypothetical protein IDH35_00055 [Pelagibacterales bacterium SAG-MED49]|nr:hypothetical protein [Pelagibacterales bacterium SAG-MED49]
MKKFTLFFIFFYFIFNIEGNAYAHDKFVGQLECKRADKKLTWIFKIDEDKRTVFIKHNHKKLKDLNRIQKKLNAFELYGYKFMPKKDEFYFQKHWTHNIHYFYINRMTGKFKEGFRPKGTGIEFTEASKIGDREYPGVCIAKERVF